MNDEVNENTLFKDFAEYYLNSFDNDKKEFSVYATRKNFGKNVYPFIGDKAVNEIKSEDIGFLISTLSEKYSRNYIWSLFRKIRQIMNKAQENGLIDKNPCDDYADFKFRPIEKKPFTEDELEKIALAIEHSKFRDLYRLSFALGIKRNEMLALKWKDIDTERGLITVSVVTERVEGKIQEVKLNRLRYYRLNQKATDILANIRSYQALINNSGDYVFCDLAGLPYKKGEVDKSIQSVKAISGISDFSFRRICTHYDISEKE